MGDYRDEREAALQRAEVLAQQNARLQTELDALRQGRSSPATTRVPRVLAIVLAIFVTMGAGFGFFATSRRSASVTTASTIELRGTWSPPSSIARTAIRAAVRSGGGTWAVGDHGAIFFRAESATAWSPVPSGTDADLHAITAGDPLVVVGARGTALRFDAAQRRWIAESTGATADLHAIVSHQSTLVAVGDGGALLRRAPDGVWSALPTPSTANLYGVTLSTLDDRFVAVGAHGTIVSLPTSGGDIATVNASPITTTLRAVVTWNNTLLAVGDGGVMVSTSALAPWTVVPSNTHDDLFAVAATEIPYEERRPNFGGSGSSYGFLAAGAHGTVLVDRLGAVEGWRSVRGGGGAIRAMTSEPWTFFTDEGNTFGFTPR